MNIYPAIDIYNGNGVRLIKGKFDAVTVYGEPSELCERWINSGTNYLHIVDLNGAKQEGNNLEIILELAKKYKVNIQVGGGIRTVAQAVYLLENKIDKVIIGTSALKDKQMTQSLIDQYGDRIIVGVDANDGYVAIEGWAEVSTIPAVDFIKDLEVMGVTKVVYTDIAKDGMMSGPNFEAYRTLQSLSNIQVVASGGVTTLEDIKMLKQIGVEGAILGKTLYEGIITLEEALGC